MTQNGLVFIGAAMDNYLRAFDLETGKELWKGLLAARSGDANDLPLGENGRQFVVIAAGGHGRLGPTSAIRWWRLLCLRVAPAFWLSQWPRRSEPSAFCWSSCWQPCSSSDWRKNWFWYPLLAILIIIATWAAWIVSQSILMSLLTMFVAVAIAWLLTLGRNRRSRPART